MRRRDERAVRCAGCQQQGASVTVSILQGSDMRAAPMCCSALLAWRWQCMHSNIACDPFSSESCGDWCTVCMLHSAFVCQFSAFSAISKSVQPSSSSWQ